MSWQSFGSSEHAVGELLLLPFLTIMMYQNFYGCIVQRDSPRTKARAIH